MPRSHESFKHESLQDCDSITKYFNALSEGFCGGTLSLSTDSKRLLLKPHGLIRLEVEGKRKDGQVKLSLHFHWSEEAPGTEDAAEESLVISSEEQG